MMVLKEFFVQPSEEKCGVSVKVNSKPSMGSSMFLCEIPHQTLVLRKNQTEMRTKNLWAIPARTWLSDSGTPVHMVTRKHLNDSEGLCLLQWFWRRSRSQHYCLGNVGF